MTMKIIYVAVSILLNGALTLRTIGSFKGKQFAAITGTIYALLSMLTGYLTVAVSEFDIFTKMAITLITAYVGIFASCYIQDGLKPLKDVMYIITIKENGLDKLDKIESLLTKFDNVSYNTLTNEQGEKIINVFEKNVKKASLDKEIAKITKSFMKIGA